MEQTPEPVGKTSERRRGEARVHSQLEQGQVGVAVVGLVFALRRDVVLENCRRLGVVAVESVQDGVNVLWPLGRVVERNTHCDYVWKMWYASLALLADLMWAVVRRQNFSVHERLGGLSLLIPPQHLDRLDLKIPIFTITSIDTSSHAQP